MDTKYEGRIKICAVIAAVSAIISFVNDFDLASLNFRMLIWIVISFAPYVIMFMYAFKIKKGPSAAGACIAVMVLEVLLLMPSDFSWYSGEIMDLVENTLENYEFTTAICLLIGWFIPPIALLLMVFATWNVYKRKYDRLVKIAIIAAMLPDIAEIVFNFTDMSWRRLTYYLGPIALLCALNLLIKEVPYIKTDAEASRYTPPVSTTAAATVAPATPVAPSDSGLSLEDELAKLSEQYQKRLISPDEYLARREEIIKRT